MKELTKQAIATAFLKRLDNRPIHQITVKDICRDCSINRQTFYYHFRDVYELCFWIMERDLKEHLDCSGVSINDLPAYLHALFDYFSKHKQRVRHGYNALNRVQYETLFKERAKPVILHSLLSYEEAESVREENMTFLTSLYILTLSGILIKWIEEGLPDIYQDLDKYCLVLDASMQTLLRKFSEL